MARRLFFAITLIGTGMLFIPPAEAVIAPRCVDQAANCVGGCADFTVGLVTYGGIRTNACVVATGR